MSIRIIVLIIATALFAWSGIAQAGTATQMWKCELDDDASEQDVEQMAQNWLAAARKMEGGAQLEAYVYFPVAVNDTGESDLIFVVVAPSFAEWGKFWDAYTDSPAEKVDIQNREKVICPDSAVWESVKVQVK
jgi:hypothetical protein